MAKAPTRQGLRWPTPDRHEDPSTTISSTSESRRDTIQASSATATDFFNSLLVLFHPLGAAHLFSPTRAVFFQLRRPGFRCRKPRPELLDFVGGQH